jgi:succinyl-diaminopimelate desuccinylase
VGSAPVASIVELARSLVAIPSQGGIDPPGDIIEPVAAWLAEHDLPPSVLLSSDGAPVGVSVDVVGSGVGPRYVLNACLDTAPFGDLGAWSSPPTAAAVRDGWLVGRGAADSKAAIAIFVHLCAEIAPQAEDFTGRLTVLFDADEHTGRFGGIRAYTDSSAPLDGVMIGYPGLDEIVVGARGFWRALLHVSGRSGHSGSRRASVDNAVVKAAALATSLSSVEVAVEGDGVFPLGPKITVTGISGGDGYSIVPDQCTVAVDIRLTPTYDAGWAEHLVRQACGSVDEQIPSRQPTVVEPDGTWPAYQLPPTSRLAAALQAGARQALGRGVPFAVAGPSNIGNLLATLGTEATCGFGVAYRNLHGPDEAIDLSSIPAVYDAYLAAVRELLSPPLRRC